MGLSGTLSLPANTNVRLLYSGEETPVPVLGTSSLPTTGASILDIDWSLDGTYFAVLSAASVDVFTRSGDTLTHLVFLDSSAVSGGGVGRVYWTADATYILVTGNTNAVKMWKRTGSTFNELVTPLPTLPYTKIAAWSSDAVYLLVGGNATVGTAYTSLYKRTGDTFAKLAFVLNASGTTFDSTVLKWSPNTNHCITRNQANTTVLWVYKRTVDALAWLAYITGQFGCWSPSGLHFVAIVSSSPYITVYSVTGDTYTPVASLTTPALTSMISDVEWSPDGTCFAVASLSASTINLVAFTFDSVESVIRPVIKSSIPSVVVYSLSWSADSKYLTINYKTASDSLYSFTKTFLAVKGYRLIDTSAQNETLTMA